MKAVPRIDPPKCLDNGDPRVRLYKERFYAAPKPWKRFGETQADGIAAGRKYVCDELLKMFDGECAFCGKRLTSDNYDTQIDHFLPQSSFGFLSLCWENLLLLCGDCNNKKGSFAPKSLEGKVLIEAFMKNSAIIPQDAEVFDKNQILGGCEDRLIDPSFDDPSTHLRFDPASRRFTPLTPIGRLMIERFFKRVRCFDECLRKLSDEIKDVVENEPQPERVLSLHITINGYSFFRRAFYQYWTELKGRRAPSEYIES